MERYMILIRTDGTGRLIRCDDGDTCKLETLQQLVGGLIETDHEDAYLAMDVKSKTEWLQRVLQIAEEQEE